jgi:hypothetical protein
MKLAELSINLKIVSLKLHKTGFFVVNTYINGR